MAQQRRNLHKSCNHRLSVPNRRQNTPVPVRFSAVAVACASHTRTVRHTRTTLNKQVQMIQATPWATRKIMIGVARQRTSQLQSHTKSTQTQPITQICGREIAAANVGKQQEQATSAQLDRIVGRRADRFRFSALAVACASRPTIQCALGREEICVRNTIGDRQIRISLSRIDTAVAHVYAYMHTKHHRYPKSVGGGGGGIGAATADKPAQAKWRNGR